MCMQDCMQRLSVAYSLWTKKDVERVLTKAVMCHKKVALKWQVAQKQAGQEQASKHMMPLPSKKKKKFETATMDHKNSSE